MTIRVTNHFNFRGNARAALEFYQSVFGGDLTLVTYKDAHNVQDPAEADQVMWGQVTAKNGFQVMAYDVPSRMPWEPGMNAFFVSVRGPPAGEISALWDLVTGVPAGRGIETARVLVAHGAHAVGAARHLGKAEARCARPGSGTLTVLISPEPVVLHPCCART
jgi:uncharacterized glyoxalase superfamily protein PhnB